MPVYQVSLNKEFDRIATQAASECCLDVNSYINKIIKEHLTRLAGEKT